MYLAKVWTPEKKAQNEHVIAGFLYAGSKGWNGAAFQ
jgi:hypothetical protein